MLLIPGTSSAQHLRENIRGASLELPADILTELNAVGGEGLPS
jgi:aryl-alcohol dehydrogenase-like predicted oxidoreductase